jgi:subtilisin-like proprotein convertase family protein
VVAPTDESWSIGLVVPDNDPVGLADTRIIAGSPVRSITDLSVSLHLSGGFVGDIYATLSHNSGFSVLLNRTGRSAANILGSDAATLEVVFRDDALTDVHDAPADLGVIMGVYQPDARNVSPLTVVDSSVRSAFLDGFVGLDANGSWTLFVADLSGADEVTLVSWGVTIDGVVPEPSGLLLAGLAVLPLLVRRRGSGIEAGGLGV